MIAIDIVRSSIIVIDVVVFSFVFGLPPMSLLSVVYASVAKKTP